MTGKYMQLKNQSIHCNAIERGIKKKFILPFVFIPIIVAGIAGNCLAEQLKQKKLDKTDIIINETKIGSQQIQNKTDFLKISRKFFIGMSPLRDLYTKKYALDHYGFYSSKIIVPKIIVIHWTDSKLSSLKSVVDHFRGDTVYRKLVRADFENFFTNIPGRLPPPPKSVNVGAHFLVDRDGTIYQLFDSLDLLKHTVGLNWCAIGIENIGSPRYPLTDRQLESNVKLIGILKQDFLSIELVIGHYQSKKLRNTNYFYELTGSIGDVKMDPGKNFMRKIINKIKNSGLDIRYINP